VSDILCREHMTRSGLTGERDLHEGVVGAIPVCQHDHRFVGRLTERLVRVMACNSAFLGLRAYNMMASALLFWTRLSFSIHFATCSHDFHWLHNDQAWRTRLDTRWTTIVHEVVGHVGHRYLDLLLMNHDFFDWQRGGGHLSIPDSHQFASQQWFTGT
jgi:hypothetical protein